MGRFLRMGRGMRFSLLSFSAFVPVCLSVFSSCKNVALGIENIQSTIVLDYKDETSLPTMRLSVFVQTSADERRVERVRLVHNQSGMEWICDNPRKIAEDERSVWAGYTNFVPATGSTFPKGIYTFHYTDMAGDESQAPFSLSYPEGLPTTTADKIEESFRNAEQIVGVYDRDGNLVYFGPRAENWQQDSDIKNSYGLAEKIRVCYRFNGGSVICMLPLKDL